jgi:hypothetical protein
MLRERGSRRLFVAILVIGLALSGLALARSMVLSEAETTPQAPSSRTIPGTFWFQGFIANSTTGDPINATYNIVARLYGVPSGGAAIWGPETHTGVSIVNGWFNIEIGSVIGGLPDFGSPPYYLQLAVNGETLTPRMKLASVPTALRADAPDLPFVGSYSGTGEDALWIEDTNTLDYDTATFRRLGGMPSAYAIDAISNSEEAVIHGYQYNNTGAYAPVAYFYTDDVDSTNTAPVIAAYHTGAQPLMSGWTNGGTAIDVTSYGSVGAAVAGYHYGSAPIAYGVYGEGNMGDGWGVGGGFQGSLDGVQAYAYPTINNTCYGVYCDADGGTSSSYGIYANASGDGTNWAGYFAGDVYVSGGIYPAKSGFKIDHPLDPAGKYLEHASVQSSDMKDVYDGVVVLDGAGRAWVELPDWFEALNGDFRYQLTAMGAPGPNLYVAEKISGNRFEIAGGGPGMEVSWQVTGIRHDKYAEANAMSVESAKPADEQGKYLHPELYGQPETQNVAYDERHAKMSAEAKARTRAGERPRQGHPEHPAGPDAQ